jgi:hypothetical protein
VRRVSDLIGRIAARAVGAPALAQPRPALPDLAPDSLEVVDEQVAVPVADLPVRSAEPVRAQPAPAAVAAPSVPAVSVVEAPPAAASPGPAAEQRSRRERRLPALERTSVDPTEAALVAPPAEPRVAAQAVPVPAAPAAPVTSVPDRPAHRWAAPAHVYTGPSERPPVRVHIGRLEVRANVQEQPGRAAPLPQPAEPEGLSLADYLRGRR